MDSTVQNRIIQAQKGDIPSRERLIEEYRPFIIRVACHVSKRRISWNDDEASIGLIAFNEAIDRFHANQGKSFDSYAYQIIANRLIDEFRRKRKTFNTHLVLDGDDEFELTAAEIASSMEAYEREETSNELASELMTYDEVLQQYGISLEELEECSPSHQDTRMQLIQIAKSFMRHPALIEHLVKTKQLPLKEMLKFVEVSKKTLERNRKYLISLILIYSFDEFSRIRHTVSLMDVGE
jgi:RNA polymerase sigma factor